MRTGKLLKGGDPDLNNVCKTIIFDWQRGKIPFFHYPPREADLKEDEEPEVAEAEAEAVGQVEEEQ